MAWLYLILAGFFEMGWPMGTAYMIWTGIGGVGTVVLGIVFFHDAVTFWRMFFLSLVFVGIVGLKMVH